MAQQQHKAIVLSSFDDPPKITNIPTPKAGPGQVIVRVLAARVNNGGLVRKAFPLSFPLVPGTAAIGRVHEAGPDAVSLQPGQLVLIDYRISARDDPSAQILCGLFNGGPGSPNARLMEGEWRNGPIAQYAKVPLENAIPLNEQRLLGDLGYQPGELLPLSSMAVTLSACEEIGVSAGETVIVAPATGLSSGNAVAVAVGLGAHVIAAARNEESLKELERVYGATGRITTMTLKGDVAADTAALKSATPGGKGAQAYIDWSPPAAAKSTHIEAVFGALAYEARVALCGFIPGTIPIPYPAMVFKNLKIKGRFMSERHTFVHLVRMAEAENLKLGKAGGRETVGTFGLDEIEDALSLAAKYPGWSKQVVLAP